MKTTNPPTNASSVAAIIRRTQEHLDQGRASEALAAIDSRTQDPYLRNARGVCLLHLGRAAEAVDVLQPLVYPGDSISVSGTCPAAFRLSFAAALIAVGNLPGALHAIVDLDPTTHPEAARIRAEVKAWSAGLGFWKRLSYRFYGVARSPMQLSTPGGVLAEPTPPVAPKGHQAPRVA